MILRHLCGVRNVTRKVSTPSDEDGAGGAEGEGTGGYDVFGGTFRLRRCVGLGEGHCGGQWTQ